MSVFVDVRIAIDDVARAVEILCDSSRPLTSRILVDPMPPAAGPEAELTIDLHSDGPSPQTILGELTDRGVVILAWRSRDWSRP